MMRSICLLVLLFVSIAGIGQVKIHAHNDYDNARPLLNALDNKVASIEADVVLARGSLIVTHSENETRRKKSLSVLYLDPIIALFEKNNGQISPDNDYKIALMIDIKQKPAEVLQELIKLVEPFRKVFDRSVNPKAVQLIISGDRGPSTEWKNFPSYIYFDGRPSETYEKEALDKIALISDNYFNYLKFRNNAGDSVLITAVIQKAHALQKPFRFWGAPDTENVWQLLKSCGIDFLNTDKLEECRKYIDGTKL